MEKRLGIQEDSGELEEETPVVQEEPEKGEPYSFVCSVKDLDLLLDDRQKERFQGVFLDPDGNDKFPDVSGFLSKFGIDFEHPTVRDAVAVDLVKLEDGSVSNKSEYEFWEIGDCLEHEHEIRFLNRNFRINLVDTEFLTIRQVSDVAEEDDKQTENRLNANYAYQGLRFSKTILGYFKSLFDGFFNSDGSMKGKTAELGKTYVPFTNANDIDLEVAAIPNIYENFPKEVSLDYYHEKWEQYKELLSEFGIDMVSSFALVDPNNFKNHTGEFLVKVQKVFGQDRYGYIVARVDQDGQFLTKENGTVDVTVFNSRYNTILSVCESDYAVDRIQWSSDEIWTPTEGIVSVPISTTSSEISVFDQYIPDSDLENVRQYLQFRTRLEGMEPCLERLNRDVFRKEVQCSDAFVQLAHSIGRLFDEFDKNKVVVDLAVKYYSQIEKYDSLYTKKVQLLEVVDEKRELLEKLLEEYNKLTDNQLERKMELGQKIKSLKLELDKSLQQSIVKLDELLEETSEIIQGIFNQIQDMQPTQSDDIQSRDFQDIGELDMSVLRAALGNAEMWRDRIFNLGFELTYLRDVQTMCSDATIQVRRLVRNFEQRMADVEEQIWDERHNVKYGFSFRGIATAGLYDIILLHDWYACNAPRKTHKEMGFADKKKFNAWRRHCNTIAYNLRKNQYSKMLEMEKVRLEDVINELQGKLSGDNRTLKYDDKYGREAKEEQDKSVKKPWSKDDVSKKMIESLDVFAKADQYVQRQAKDESQYKIDQKQMRSRTIAYMKDMGLISEEADLERLAVGSVLEKSPELINENIGKLNKWKRELDAAVAAMEKEKNALKTIIDRVHDAEKKSKELKAESKRLFEASVGERNRNKKTKMLLQKVENEEKVQQLDAIVKKTRKQHLSDFNELERLKKVVDTKKEEYAAKVREFKEKIGVDQDLVEQLVIGIYNKYQDEILNREKK